MMSCIKFPSTKNEIEKATNKGNFNDCATANSHLIATANHAFGQGNWSHSISNQTLDYIDYIAGKYQAGCVSIVRIQLNNGIFHEEVGYSSTEGSSKGSAIQRARLGSFNTAFKKALMSFGSEIADKSNGSSSESNNSMPLELIPMKPFPVEESLPTVKEKNETVELFPGAITLSQTDALMDTVDLDQIFSKDQKSDNNITNEETKIPRPPNTSKPLTPTGILLEKEKTSNNANIPKKEDILKQSLSTSNNSTDKDKMNNNKNEIKKENKAEISNLPIHTAMTEEEMRLERKRKQREMQEEFKRKEEFKRMHVENGEIKATNPRY